MADFPTDGDRVIEFAETFLTLGGSFLGQPFRVMPWMQDVLRDIYRLDPDNEYRRLHRTYVLGVPRKQGKTILGAAVALYQLIADDADSAPQVISAAGDRRQARLCFDEAKRMVLSSPELKAACTVYRDEIRSNHNGGIYRAVSADAGLAHGLNPSTVIVDEMHVFRNDDLYVALTSGSAMRNEPLTLVISTAGWDIDGPFGRLYQYGKRVQSGEVEDPSFGMTWYGPNLDEDLDWGDPEVWERFNPSWPILNKDEFASAYRATPESEFIRYRLNGWTSTQESWFPAGAWDSRSNTSDPISPEDEVILGFDGAWKGDSTALVAIRIEDLHLEVVGVWEAPIGDQHWRVPVKEVTDEIREACRKYNVREVVADPSRWEYSLQELAEEGLPIVEMPNTVSRMVPATQSFYESVMDGQLSHSGDPALSRHVANCVLKMDSRGARITKVYKSSTKHIDIAVAAVMAHHRAKLWRDHSPAEPQLII